MDCAIWCGIFRKAERVNNRTNQTQYGSEKSCFVTATDVVNFEKYGELVALKPSTAELLVGKHFAEIVSLLAQPHKSTLQL